MKKIFNALIRYHGGVMVIGAILGTIANLIAFGLHRSLFEAGMELAFWGLFVPGLVLGMVGTVFWLISAVCAAIHEKPASARHSRR